MNDDYAHLFVPDDHPGVQHARVGGGRHRGPVDTRHVASPADPLDSAWDPVEEMTYLLQDAVSAEHISAVPRPRSETAPHVTLTGDPMDNLATITSELPPIRPHPAGHRKVRVRRVRFTWVQTVSFLLAALAAVVVSMVSVFSGIVSYVPLRQVAFLTQSGTTTVWWPLLVYGPWTVGSLSILRAALHQRRAAHSWFVVLLFSSVAMALCAAQADRTFTGLAAAVLPSVAALACFQQLVRQITMTRPPRQSLPRHRLFTSTAPRTVAPAATGSAAPDGPVTP